jgi:hypothetical protein
MRIVREPKSVCSPRLGFGVGALGGAQMKRTWQPEGEESLWRSVKVEGGRWREVAREVKSVVRMVLLVWM